MAKTKNNTYSGSIRTSKKEDFEIFLNRIGLSEDEVEFDEEGRGEYILYTINLSGKQNFIIHNLREELNSSILDFL